MVEGAQKIFFFFRNKYLLSSDFGIQGKQSVGYNLPDSYLGIPLSIFTINITLGNKNIKYYTIKCYVYIIVEHTQLKFVPTFLAYCY